MSAILFANYTTRLRKWVEVYVSEAQVLSSVDYHGWVETGSYASRVVPILERFAAKCIEWGKRRGLQSDTAKTEAAVFTHRRGHRIHLWPKLTAKIQVGSGFI